MSKNDPKKLEEAKRLAQKQAEIERLARLGQKNNIEELLGLGIKGGNLKPSQIKANASIANNAKAGDQPKPTPAALKQEANSPKVDKSDEASKSGQAINNEPAKETPKKSKKDRLLKFVSTLIKKLEKTATATIDSTKKLPETTKKLGTEVNKARKKIKEKYKSR